MRLLRIRTRTAARALSLCLTLSHTLVVRAVDCAAGTEQQRAADLATQQNSSSASAVRFGRVGHALCYLKLI